MRLLCAHWLWAWYKSDGDGSIKSVFPQYADLLLYLTVVVLLLSPRNSPVPDDSLLEQELVTGACGYPQTHFSEMWLSCDLDLCHKS